MGKAAAPEEELAISPTASPNVLVLLNSQGSDSIELVSDDPHEDRTCEVWSNGSLEE